jgi:hypothetical protein
MFLIPQSQWEVRKTKSKGRGVFAKEEIAGGTVIGDYIGRVLNDEQHEEYEKKHGLYAMEWNDEATVYADPDSIGIHLINHSCAPNCDAYTYEHHTLYFALRKIFPGEEISVSYNLGPPSKDNPITEACHCGSPLCRGTMSLPTTLSEKYATTLREDMGDEFAELPVKFGEMLPRLEEYPPELEDDEIYDLFANTKVPPMELDDEYLPNTEILRKLLREGGRQLHFRRMKLIVYGIENGIILLNSKN